jgi:hypothetical protein
MEFNDDLTTMSLVGLGTTQDLQIDYNGGTVTIEEYENEMLVIWQMNGNIMFCMNGQIGFVEENTDLTVNWLHYDKSTDELTLLDFTSGNTAVNEDVPYYEAASYTSIICTDNGEYMGVPTQPGVFVNTEIMEQYSNSSSDDTDYYIDMRSPFASTMLMRDDIINEDPGTISVHQLQFEEGYISYESFDNVWPDAIVSVVEYADNEYWNQNSYDLLSPVSNYYYVTMRRDYPVQIVFECDEVPDNASIYYFESSIWDDPEEVETTYSGDLAMAIIDRSGIYFFGSALTYTELTPDNYFDTDPSETSWAIMGQPGDIIDLVDMDYIEESYNGVFVVDSVEDLASLTYFVNTYPREYGDSYCVWVDLTADIDLTGYNWATMGINNYEEDRCFNGIFCGNGHTIRGLTIDNNSTSNAFLGDIYSATVIGVNLEDAYITGSSSGLLVCNSSTSDYFDCHVEGVLPDSLAEDAEGFNNSTRGNNGFWDCSIEVTNANNETFVVGFSDHEPSDNAINLLYETFDPEHDGIYDYSEDYFFG